MKSFAPGRQNSLGVRAIRAVVPWAIPICLLLARADTCLGNALPLRDGPPLSYEEAISNSQKKAASKQPSVQLELLSAGLAGAVPASGGAFVIRYRLVNNGPSLKARLALVEKSTTEYRGQKPLPIMQRLGLADKIIEIPASSSAAGEWIIGYADNWSLFNAYGNNISLVVADDLGRALDVKPVFDQRMSGSPFVVLAIDKEQGIAVEGRIRTVLPTEQAGYAPLSSVYNPLPDTWYEYKAASRVILARPFSSMTGKQAEALRDYVLLGGTLLIAREYVPDFYEDAFRTFNSGLGRAVVVDSLSNSQLLSYSGQLISPLPSMLKAAYRLPDFRLFLAAVILIVLLIGPGLHITLAKMGRREWIWVAAPLLGIVAAFGMYGLAQAVKGDKSAVEIHHYLVGGEGAPRFSAKTAVRLQSAQKAFFDIKFEGKEPAPDPIFDSYQYRHEPPFSVLAERGSVLFSKLFMKKWSTRDVGAESPIEPYSITRTANADGSVRVFNRGGAPLYELYYLRGFSWYKIPNEIGRGEQRTFYLTKDEEVSDNATSPANPQLPEPVRAMLFGIRTNFSSREILVATCAPPSAPKVTVSPTPKIVKESFHCVFLFPEATNAAAPVSMSGNLPPMKEASP